MSGTDGDVGHSIVVVSPSYITGTGDHSHCIMIMFGIYNTKVVCKMTDTHDRIPASRQFHHLALRPCLPSVVTRGGQVFTFHSFQKSGAEWIHTQCNSTGGTLNQAPSGFLMISNNFL